jgi:transcriptional regulator NrdR family protein
MPKLTADICPSCKGRGLVVIDVRHVKRGIRRRRKCTACGERFTSYEIADTRLDELEQKARKFMRFQEALRSAL